MSRNVQYKTVSKRIAPAGIIFAVLGLVLFVFFVYRTGVTDIIQGIMRVGAGFLLVLAISFIRPVVRSLAWIRCFEAPHRLKFRDALRAYMIGDAVGNLMPLGIVVSEPAKAALVRDRVPLVAGVSALAVENLFYSLSVILFIFSGTAALLLTFPLSKNLRLVSFGLLTGLVVILLFAYLIIRKQWKFLSRALEYLYKRRAGGGRLETWRGRVAAIEDRVYGFYEHHRGRFLKILFLEACYHSAGVIEGYVTLYFITGTPPTLLVAFLLESVNRAINIVFKVVPLRVGVDEAGTGLFTQLLKFGTASGVTLAIIRKARILCWTAVGVALLVGRGLSLSTIMNEAQETGTTDAEPKRELKSSQPSAISYQPKSIDR